MILEKTQVGFAPELGKKGEKKQLRASPLAGIIGEVIQISFLAGDSLEPHEQCARVLSVTIDGRVQVEPVGEKRKFDDACRLSWDVCPKGAEIVLEVEYLVDGVFVASVFGSLPETMDVVHDASLVDAPG